MEFIGRGPKCPPYDPLLLGLSLLRRGFGGNYVPPEGGVKGELLVLLIVYV
jgi:hypothetical protein